MDEYGSLSHSKWECKYHVVLLFRNVVAECCMEICADIWARCSESCVWAPSVIGVKVCRGLRRQCNQTNRQCCNNGQRGVCSKATSHNIPPSDDHGMFMQWRSFRTSQFRSKSRFKENARWQLESFDGVHADDISVSIRLLLRIRAPDCLTSMPDRFGRSPGANESRSTRAAISAK